MMKKLHPQIQALRALAEKRLTNVIKEFTKDVDSNEFDELPIYFNVNDHGFYEEYAIVGINNGKLLCIGKGETPPNEITVGFEQIDTANLCYLADIV